MLLPLDLAGGALDGLNPTVQVALIGGTVTLASLIMSTVLDRAFSKKQPDPPPVVPPTIPVPIGRTDDDDALVEELVRRATDAERRCTTCERERDRLRRVYGDLRDRVWALGYNPDNPDPAPRPKPRRNP